MQSKLGSPIFFQSSQASSGPSHYDKIAFEVSPSSFCIEVRGFKSTQLFFRGPRERIFSQRLIILSCSLLPGSSSSTHRGTRENVPAPHLKLCHISRGNPRFPYHTVPLKRRCGVSAFLRWLCWKTKGLRCKIPRVEQFLRDYIKASNKLWKKQRRTVYIPYWLSSLLSKWTSEKLDIGKALVWFWLLFCHSLGAHSH